MARPTCIYATTFCNMGHLTSNGKPVGHECHVIPPAALAAEMSDDVPRAIELMDAARRLGKMRMHRGVKPPAICTVVGCAAHAVCEER